MRARIAALCLSVFLGAAMSSAQDAPQAAPVIPQADFSAVNCSGFVTDQRVPDEIQLVSGEQSNYKLTWVRGDYVYINRGQDKGVRVGDRFSVVRPDKDPTEVQWFKWQDKLMRAMGTAYLDAGQLQVVNVQPKVSVAEVIFSCGYMQRGDIEARGHAGQREGPFKFLRQVQLSLRESGKQPGCEGRGLLPNLPVPRLGGRDCSADERLSVHHVRLRERPEAL